MLGRFRRSRETQNQRLLREASIGAPAPVEPGPEPAETPSPFFLSRSPTPRLLVRRLYEHGGIDTPPREWHALVLVEAPGLAGSEIVFYVLAGGSMLVETQEGDEPLDALADALAGKLEPPYEAHAGPAEGGSWSVRASPRIAIVRLPRLTADEVLLGVYDGEHLVDDEPVADATVFEPLDELAAGDGLTDFTAAAKRLEDDTFAVTITPL